MLTVMAILSTPDHEEDLVITADGHVHGPEIDRLGGTFVVEFGEDSKGLRCIRSVTVRHPEGVTGTLLRQIPVARVERQHLRELAEKVAQMDAMAERISEQPSALDELKAILAARQGPGRHMNLPARFFQVVAALYNFHVGYVSDAVPTPAHYIAVVSGTPLSTVKGWIHRARLRGDLPPARRGRAG
jgi:hypothetical protein